MDDTGDDETPRYNGGSQCDEKAKAFYWFNEHTGESRWEPRPRWHGYTWWLRAIARHPL
jgi:hypothetical protein